MDKPSTSMADAIKQLNGRSSTMATYRTMKRHNPNRSDKPDEIKKRKIEEPVNHSVDQTKHYFPIASLRPVFACPEIKGTLTVVSDWLTARSQAKFLIFHIRDESGEIKGLAFDPMGVDFHNKFKIGATVILKNSKVEVDKGANKTDGSKSYKLIVNRFSLIEFQDISPAPPNPVRNMIRDILDSSNERDIVDVLGILEDVDEMKRDAMREIRIVDESEANIIITLWDNAAKNFDAPLGSVIAAYRVAVRTFNSTTFLRTCLMSQLLVDPPIDDTPRLKKWYSEWTATAEARENKNSELIENTVQATNNSIIDNRKSGIVDCFASTSTSNYNGNYISIEDVFELSAGAVVNITGFVAKQEPPAQLTTKSGIIRWMKIIQLTNGKDCRIEMTIWGDAVRYYDFPLNCAISAKNVKVRNFCGEKTLCCLWTDVKIERNVSQTAGSKIISSNNSTTNEIENSGIAGSSRLSFNPLNFRKITSINDIKHTGYSGSKYNIVALVTECGPLEQIPTKVGDRKWMRVVTLTDNEHSEIKMTIWGGLVEVYDIPVNSVIMARNATVREYKNDKTLNCFLSHLQIEPNVPQADSLRKLIPSNWSPNLIKNPDIAGSSTSQKFTSIKNIKDIGEAGSRYNIVALVTKCDPPKKQISKDGKKMWMRVIMLMDDNDSEMEMAVWGDPVEDNDIPLNSVIMAKNIVVRNFNDKKTFGCLWLNIQIEPDVPEVAKLKNLITKNPTTNEVESSVIAQSSISSDNVLHETKITLIKEIKDMSTAKSRYNIVAVVTKCRPPKKLQTKVGNTLWMREIMLMDGEGGEIEMTIWGHEVRTNHIPLHSVIMAKDVTVRDFNDNKTLSCLWSHIQIDPDVPQTARLMELVANSSASSQTEEFDVVDQFEVDCNSEAQINVHAPQILFTPISEIKSDETTKSPCNIIGIVIELQSPEVQMAEAEKDSYKKVVIISDEPESKIALTIWGEEVMDHEIPLHCVLAAQNVTIKHSNDETTLDCFWMDLEINPDIPKADEIAKISGNYRYATKKRDDSNYFDSFEQIMEETGYISKWNLIGLVEETKPSMQLDSSSKQDFWFTKVNLIDADRNRIELVVWSNESLESAIPLGSILAVKGAEARMADNRVAVGAFWHLVTIDPDIPAAERIRQLRKTQWESRWPNYRECVDVEIGDYTTIDMIKTWNKPRDCLHTIGLVVEVNPPKEIKIQSGHTCYIKKCVLRGKEGSEIELTILSNSSNPFEIPLNSVIAARDATLNRTKDTKKLALCCRLVNVKFDIDIPEINGFKEASVSPFNRFENPETQDPNNYTPIKVIKETTPLGSILNVLGLVIDVIKQSPKHIGDNTQTVRVTLMDTERDLITLLIRKNPETDNAIKAQSIIAAKDATLLNYCDDKVLWCPRSRVEINPGILETQWNKLAKLRSGFSNLISFSNFIPFKTILHDCSLIKCNVDIIGQVVEILPPDKKQNRCRDISNFLLRNEIDIKLIIWRYKRAKRCANDHDNIAINTIIAAKRAEVITKLNETCLSVNWRDVKINPKISEMDRGAKSLCIVPIKRILEEAKVGDKLGILAVVRDAPEKMLGSLDIKDSFEDIDEEISSMSKCETGRLCAKLIDSSGETINMTMPYSVAEAVRKNSDKTIVIQVRNVQVCKFKGNLELACTCRASEIEFNPATEEAEELLEWYATFCKKEKNEKKNNEQRELSIIPINMVLKNWANETGTAIMGILIASQMYKIKESGLRFEIRRIRIIDESEQVINFLMWNLAAKNFDVPLYSVILVRNFHVYTEDNVKWGIFGSGTEYKVITAVGKYLEATQRLETWFDHYYEQSRNLIDSSDESNNEEKNPISLLNSIKFAKNSIILSNDVEMVESPSILSNDIEMVESPTILSNDKKMVKSPTVSSNDKKTVENPTVLSNDNKMVENPIILANDIEMFESPIVLSNDNKMIESPIILANDIEMVESPIVLSDDIDLVESSQKIEDNSRIFFGTDFPLSQKNERITEISNVNDVIDYDSDSPDIFADC